ncbi:MAG: hypothetical protein ACT6QT_11915 [Sphingopyxis sp.]|uniref:hypothetical protein n=1 Tax=Sphingopyxis sp. TaxID=1908224 RepID=UPI0040363875
MTGVGVGIGGICVPGNGMTVGAPGFCADGDGRGFCGSGIDTCAAAVLAHSADSATLLRAKPILTV